MKLLGKVILHILYWLLMVGISLERESGWPLAIATWFYWLMVLHTPKPTTTTKQISDQLAITNQQLTAIHLTLMHVNANLVSQTKPATP